MSFYQFDKPIRRVAVIGGGPSGIPAARHLRDAGLDVVVFDQQPEVGGVWNYSEERIETPFPSSGTDTPLLEDAEPSEVTPFTWSTPCYWNLRNNVPTKTMAFKDWPYPENTADNIPHHEFASYIQRYWRNFDMPRVTRLNTKVEDVRKVDGEWHLRLIEARPDATPRIYNETFDVILVATGHYSVPSIPDIPGASHWNDCWSGSIIHSKQYRRPEHYNGKTVLIIGGGTSGMDIAHDLSGHVERLLISSRIDPKSPAGYQTFRDGQRHRGPPGSEMIGQIASFDHNGSSPRDSHIRLIDGSVVTGVDTIIFCTGYQYSFPFLSQFRQAPNSSAHHESLVINGDYVHNLYRDVFYIPDPTLAFIGISVNTSAFSFFESQSISVARVFSGKARLPAEPEQRSRLERVVSSKGAGKFRHFLGREGERAYVRDTVEWLNGDAAELGAERIEGHSEQWLWESDQNLIKITKKLGLELGSFGDLSGNLVPRPPGDPVLRTQTAAQ